MENNSEEQSGNAVVVVATATPVRSKGSPGSLASKNINLAEFITLEPSQIRCRHPAILKLYKYRISNDKRNRDALCNGCGKIVVKSKVSRLIYHSKKCTSSDETLVQQLDLSFKSVNDSLRSESGCLRKLRPEVKKLQKAFDDQIVELISMNSLPPNLINSKEFKNLLASVDLSCQIPTIERLHTLLNARANSETSKLLSKFKESDSYSLTIELIGYSSTLLAVVLTANNGFSLLLDLFDITSEPNSATNIASKALAAIQASKIPEIKFNAIISDDSSHFMLARDIIYEDFNKGKMIEYRSFAHLLNQMSCSLMKSLLLKGTFENLLKLIEIFNRNRYLVLKLREKGQPKGFELIPTRKSATHSCINWALQIRSTLIKLPKLEKYQSSFINELLENENFWSDLEKSEPFFDKLAQTIKVASSSKLSDAFHAYLEFGKFLILDNKSVDPNIKVLFLESYVTYFHRLDLALLFTAYVLDPNKKMANLTNKAIRMAKEYIAKMVTIMGHKDDVTKVAINEFKRYTQNLKLIEEEDDIYSWWASSERDSIILKVVANRLAAAPASAVNTKKVSQAIDQHVNQDDMNMSTLFDLLSIYIAQISSSMNRRKDITLETSILDPNTVNTCVELTEDSSYFYSSAPYQEFKSLVDYGSPAYND